MASNGEQQERYGFVVFTGRYKILDYHKPDGQQIATADGEDEARTIVRALNAYSATDKMRAALEAITRIAGNLSDEQVENVNGVNDARSRALMVTTARQIAQNALAEKGS